MHTFFSGICLIGVNMFTFFVSQNTPQGTQKAVFTTLPKVFPSKSEKIHFFSKCAFSRNVPLDTQKWVPEHQFLSNLVVAVLRVVPYFPFPTASVFLELFYNFNLETFLAHHRLERLQRCRAFCSFFNQKGPLIKNISVSTQLKVSWTF